MCYLYLSTEQCSGKTINIRSQPISIHTASDTLAVKGPMSDRLIAHSSHTLPWWFRSHMVLCDNVHAGYRAQLVPFPGCSHPSRFPYLPNTSSCWSSSHSVCASSLPFGVGNTPSCVWALASVVFCITILSSEVLLRPRPSHNPLDIPPGFHRALQRAVLKWTFIEGPTWKTERSPGAHLGFLGVLCTTADSYCQTPTGSHR